MATLRKRTTTRTPAKATRTNTQYSSVTDKIKPVAEMAGTVSALFYGKAGTGKTTVACSFPGPILLMDLQEKGTDSVVDVKGVDVIQVQDWDEVESIYWFLHKGDHKYKTVVLDVVTVLQDYAVDKAMEEDNKVGQVVSKRQWGQASGKLKTWITNYRDLIDQGINVVFLAHDRAHEGEDGEDGELTPSVGPRMMPSVASTLNAAVKLIGNTMIRETHTKDGLKTVRKVEYAMRLGPHAYYITKVRQPKGSYIPDYLDDPTYEKLVALMKGEFKPERPAPTRKRTPTRGK